MNADSERSETFRNSVKMPADILKYFEESFLAVTRQAWCFQVLQQIACEICGLIPSVDIPIYGSVVKDSDDFFPWHKFMVNLLLTNSCSPFSFNELPVLLYL